MEHCTIKKAGKLYIFTIETACTIYYGIIIALILHIWSNFAWVLVTSLVPSRARANRANTVWRLVKLLGFLGPGSSSHNQNREFLIARM